MVGVMLAFLTAWGYATTNVMNRALKDINFTVIGFWHPVAGLLLSFCFIIAEYILTGSYYESHTNEVYFYMFLGCFLDLIGVNAYNIAT